MSQTAWARKEILWAIDEFIRAATDLDQHGVVINTQLPNRQTLGTLVQERNRIASFLGQPKSNKEKIAQEKK
jgi:hypothetical protein